MAIEVNYGNFAGTGVTGLADYLTWFKTNYYDPAHAGISGFSTADGNNVTVGSTTSLAYVNDDQFAGKATSNTPVPNTPVVAWIAHAGEVGNVYNGSGSFDLDKLAYTLFNSPQHTLFGDIGNLEFGNTYTTSGGLNSISQKHLNITGISTTANNYGLLDVNTGDAYAYDTVNNYTNGNNLTHNIIYGLMGGLGGPSSTTALEGTFNTYGIKVIGTTGNDTFDSYAVSDTFVLKGGDDVIHAGFDYGSGGDVIDLRGYHGFANYAALEVELDDDGLGNAVLEYGASHSVVILGLDYNDLTSDNFLLV